MQTSPTLSVIIPLYNKEREIEGTLRSVLAQKHLPDEIIVVDDGSTDGSAQIVERLAAESALIRLIRQQNAGECAARNCAIAAARGEIIALLDADDEWEPDFLGEILSLYRDFPDCGLYCTGFQVISHEGSFPAKAPQREGLSKTFSATRHTATSPFPRPAPFPSGFLSRWGASPKG